MESGEVIYQKVCVTSTTTENFLQRKLDERIGFGSRWKQRRHPTNHNKTNNPIIKNGTRNEPSLIATLLIKRNMIKSPIQRERRTRVQTRIHKRCVLTQMLKMFKQARGNPWLWVKKEEHKIDFRVPGLSHSIDQRRCLVWSRKQKLKNGAIQPELCASACWTCRQRRRRRRKRRRRSNKNGENREWTIVHSARGKLTLIPEYKDCHMQLWKKQKISEFKSLSKRSKVNLRDLQQQRLQHLQQQFEGDNSRIGQMLSYSSCVNLHQKYIVLTVFFIVEGIVYCICNAWLTANPGKVQQSKDGCTLYP